jgi:hypothetical protein
VFEQTETLRTGEVTSVARDTSGHAKFRSRDGHQEVTW